MILNSLPVYPPFLLVKVWDDAFYNNSSIPIPFADIREDTSDLQINDHAQLLALTCPENETSVKVGKIWVRIMDFFDDSPAFVGKVVVPDPSVPETQKIDVLLFYPENVYDIKTDNSGFDNEPEQNTF